MGAEAGALMILGSIFGVAVGGPIGALVVGTAAGVAGLAKEQSDYDAQQERMKHLEGLNERSSPAQVARALEKAGMTQWSTTDERQICVNGKYVIDKRTRTVRRR